MKENMEKNKPKILIGIVGNSQQLEVACWEVAYGIEEEGCYSDIYFADNMNDTRYLYFNTCIIISEKTSLLCTSDLNNGKPLYSVSCKFSKHKAELFRMLGKNAGKYVKQKPLHIMEEYPME